MNVGSDANVTPRVGSISNLGRNFLTAAQSLTSAIILILMKKGGSDPQITAKQSVYVLASGQSHRLR